MKTEEIRTAERLFAEIRPRYGDDLDSCVRLATLGNTIDFFKNPAAVAEQMKRPVDFAVDHMDEFEDKLTKAQKILYLADNAGECFFDLPLLRKMRGMTQVIYVVKGFPVQNDITLEGLAEAGLETAMAPVIGTGSDALTCRRVHRSSNTNSKQRTWSSPRGWGIMKRSRSYPSMGRSFTALWPNASPSRTR